ncbi:MAG: hypothetical protein V3W22_04895 [Thermoplasmata archaeon]
MISTMVGRSGLRAAFEFNGIFTAKARARRRTEKLRNLPIEDVLTAHKNNHDIRYSQARKAGMEKPSIVSAGKLQIRTATDEYEFLLPNEECYQEHADLLQSVLEEKLSFR